MGKAPPGVRVPELFFDHHGGWRVDGEPIRHARTLLVLTRNLRLDDDGVGFVTSIGREVAPVRVEDVGFFVRSCTLDARGLVVSLSDGTEERLAAPQLVQRGSGELYCRVKSGRAWARFERGAFQSLEPLWQERAGQIGLLLGEDWIAVA